MSWLIDVGRRYHIMKAKHQERTLHRRQALGVNTKQPARSPDFTPVDTYFLCISTISVGTPFKVHHALHFNAPFALQSHAGKLVDADMLSRSDTCLLLHTVLRYQFQTDAIPGRENATRFATSYQLLPLIIPA
jgi:hypothetical protein